MMNHFRRPSLVSLLLLAGLAAGCIDLGKGTARLPRLYVLTAMASATDRVTLNRTDPITIGVGPLAFPEYLDRPQLVTRTGGAEVELAPFANWAEPLKQNVLRVMVDNLATIATTGGVYRYPWRAGYAPQFQLQMEVDRFDAQRNGSAVLAVSWEWLDQDGQPLMPRERSVLRQPLQGDTDDDVVTAMSRLLYSFCRITAAQLAKLLS